MKCPHCLVEFTSPLKIHYLGEDPEGGWAIEQYECQNDQCKKFLLYLSNGELFFNRTGGKWQFFVNSDLTEKKKSMKLIRPKAIARAPIPIEVPANIALDFAEACLVLSDSPKSSAALSRRCLQNLLHDQGISKRNLSEEIQYAIDNERYPSALVDSIDAVRNIGNFAAHPGKSESTGEIVEVEPGEAEWTIEVLELLFDHYFVQPARIRARREALNQKLRDAQKPEMK